MSKSTKPRKKSTPEAPVAVAMAAPALPAPVPAALPAIDGGVFAIYRDGASLAKENLTLLTAINAALSDGMERIGLEITGLTRGTLEAGAATASALLDARTLADVAALNGEFARACADRMAASAMKLSELAFQTASEVYEPWGARLERAFAAQHLPLSA